MADEEELDDLEEKPKRSPLVLILIVVNVVVIGGAVAAVLLLRGGGESDEAEEEEDVAAADEPGPIHHFDPFVVNLTDPGESHYLKVSVSVELMGESAKGRFEPRKTQARHAVLMTLSSLAVVDTRDVDSREQLRERLRDELEEVVGPRSVKSVYFTDFVTQ